jgi:hypothetical protein
VSKFGWSLPPGCTQRMIDDAFGHEEPCEVCGKMPDDCICPECVCCGEIGRLFCYDELPPVIRPTRPGEVSDDPRISHGMVRTPEQIASKAAADKLLEEWLDEERRQADAYVAEMEMERAMFDRAAEGIFQTHRCWRCNDGKKACVEGGHRNCTYIRARND